MRSFLVIGIGTGNPEHMTVQAINALNGADLVLVPRKGPDKADLAELRLEICRRYLTSATTTLIEFDLPVRSDEAPTYRVSVDDWHEAIARAYDELLRAHAGDDARIALLVWGDPSLYDSTLRILERLRAISDADFRVEVVPGITSIQALSASHAIALNTIGGPIHVTTGRRLRDEGFPPDADSVVVMLDGELSFRTLNGADYDIWWGAYLGSEDESTVSGHLAEVAGTITEMRRAARERRGWIMDTYLLRRRMDG